MPTKEPRALAERLHEILAYEEERRRRGAAGHDAFERKCNWTRQEQLLLAAVEPLLS